MELKINNDWHSHKFKEKHLKFIENFYIIKPCRKISCNNHKIKAKQIRGLKFYIQVIETVN